MIEQKASRLNDYFDAQISLCEQRGKKLLADDRTDEANFEKVKANIYDIFRTIFSAGAKSCKDDSEAVKRFFMLKIQQIPTTWTEAYNKAKQHNDGVKMRIEQIKLDTAGEIRETFAEIWEEEE